MSLPQRLRDARAALGLSQKEIAEQSGVSARGYQGYEDGRSTPGGDAIAGLVRLGINANWLLTGEGPMLLKDLKAGGAVYFVEEPEMRLHPANSMKINRGALAAILRGAIAITAQGMSTEKAADMAAEMYAMALESGEITPEGIGEGSLDRAA